MITDIILLHGVAGVGKGYIANKIKNDIDFAKLINHNINENTKFISISIATTLKKDLMDLLAINSIELLNKFKVKPNMLFDIPVDTVFTLIKQKYKIRTVPMLDIINSNSAIEYSTVEEQRSDMLLLDAIHKYFNVSDEGIISTNVRSLHQQYADLLKYVTSESIFVSSMLNIIETEKQFTNDNTILIIDDLRYYVEAQEITKYCILSNIKYSICLVYGNNGYNLDKHSSEVLLDKLTFDKYIYNSKVDTDIKVFDHKWSPDD